MRPLKSQLWDKIDRSISGMKFAVVIISLITLAMIVGTVIESYYGTSFAQRLIYRSVPFYLLEFFLVLSVSMALFDRFPFKKRKIGFYMIHIGILTIMAGSFLTGYAGIDGSLTLKPGEPSRTVRLDEDQVKIYYPDRQETVTYHLPQSAFSSTLGQEFRGIQFEQYLPFAQIFVDWQEHIATYPYSSSRYLFFDSGHSREVTMTLTSKAKDYGPLLDTGPLLLAYMPDVVMKCLEEAPLGGLITWDTVHNTCQLLDEKKLIQKPHPQAGTIFSINQYDYFPQWSIHPIDQHLRPVETAPHKIFRKFHKPNRIVLFLSPHFVAYQHEGKWIKNELSLNEIVSLPWSDIHLRPLENHENKIPVLKPLYQLPIQNSGQLIQGKQKAVTFKLEEQSYWISPDHPLQTQFKGENVEIYMTSKTMTLPFELTLQKFNMDFNPGTRQPASYESTVQLFDKQGHSQHKIYMNNPLKHQGLTFYQASYFEIGNDYASVLSTNLDPGRGLKYFGSLILVLGSIVHFSRRKRQHMTTSEV